MRRLQSWPATIGLSLFVGAIAGAACIAGLVFLAFCGFAIFAPTHGGVLEGVGVGAYIVFICFVYAFFIWLAGIAILGLGPWWVLHQLGFRDRLAAAGLGFAMPALLLSLFGAALWGAPLGAIGIVVAETIWSSAYKYGAGAEEISLPDLRLPG